MDPTSQQDIPIPINITFASGGHGHTIHHHRHQDNDQHQYENDYLSLHNNTIQSTGALQLRVQHIPCNPTINDDDVPQNDICNDKKQHDHHDDEEMVIINYRECLKNHAASMGGCATDGCGEFMPSGQRGTLEALICSACNCHRNFHRKELQGHHHQSQGLMPTSVVASSSCYNYHGLQRPHHMRMMVNNKDNGSASRKVANMVYPAYSGATTAIPCMPVPPLMSTYNMAGRPDDLHHVGGGGVLMMGKYRGGEPPTPLPPPLSHQQLVAEMNGNNKKRRFRTKFTQEQKEKMFNFAEKVGWKIQKQEDSVVQQLCQEIGIKRRVLKIWMHNDKHNLSRKISSSITSPPPTA